MIDASSSDGVLDLPLHGRIGLDLDAILTQATPHLSWALLEAKLFEDMAALWNAGCDQEIAARTKDDKAAQKLFEATLRATAKAAFQVVEEYINGSAAWTRAIEPPWPFVPGRGLEPGESCNCA